MGLEKLARELEETARQSATMVQGVTEGLASLSDPALAAPEARERAIAQIVLALQMQDRIDQRCRGLARAARELAHAAPDEGEQGAAVWAGIGLDELRDERHARTTRQNEPGEIELF